MKPWVTDVTRLASHLASLLHATEMLLAVGCLILSNLTYYLHKKLLCTAVAIGSLED